MEGGERHLAGQGAVRAAVAKAAATSGTRAAAIHAVVWANQGLVLGREKDGLGVVDGVRLDARGVDVVLDVPHLDYVPVHIASDLQTSHRRRNDVNHNDVSFIVDEAGLPTANTLSLIHI